MTLTMEDGRADKPGFAPNAVHMIRTVQVAQMQLSAMADQKASLLMGANFVIFTLTVGRAQGSGESVPLLILAAAALVSAVFAILAVLPATRQPTPTPNSNVAFFGVFTQMPEEEFVDEITRRLRTEDEMFRTMARDIHQAGMVLQRKKYRLLKYAYWALLGGLLVSGLALVLIQLN